MLGVGEVHVRDDVHNAAVGLLGKTLVLAAVACLHVEDGDVEPLGRDRREAGVRVAEHKQGVGLDLGHQFVGSIDDVADALSQIGSRAAQIHVGIAERKVSEEDAVQRVVIVLSRVREETIEVSSALLYHLGQADDLGAGAYDDEQLEAAVALELELVLLVKCHRSNLSKITSHLLISGVCQY